MKKSILFTALLCLLHIELLTAQDYWQQGVNTRIQVTLDDQNHMLHGWETIDYTNNSPDTLKFIYFHLWPNAYSNDRTAFTEQQVRHRSTDFYFSKESDRGYIDSIDFQINGFTAHHISSAATPDITRVELPEPLLPGQKIQISTPFRVKLPKVFSRLGHNGQAYFISQWFPKPAVYDRKGWHPMPYLNYGEFYSEVGSYEVTITLPENYIVMATGNCVTDSENAWLDSLAAAPLLSDTLYNKTTPASSPRLKTIVFKEDNVHDFAWFADKRWMVRKDSILLPGTQSPIITWSAFLPSSAKIWSDANRYLVETVQHYSKLVGIYPYKTIKAVEGDMHAGGGMEYPTITVIDRGAGNMMLKRVLVHEAGHNWFYGILASNERDHAWMDEGMNTFYEIKVMDATNEKKAATINNELIKSLSEMERMLYFQAAASGTDQKLDQTSALFSELNYGIGVYHKTAVMLQWLEAYMGVENFQNAIHEYFKTWKFKHPYPEDLKKILQKHSQQSIDWFFDGALQTERPVDFKIKRWNVQENNARITVRNKSDFIAPAGIEFWQNEELVSQTWLPPFDRDTSFEMKLPEHWTHVRISQAVPDLKKSNSTLRNQAMFKKGGIKPGLILGTNMSEKERVWISPAIGYNYYDGFHGGLLLHNLTIPETKFRFVLAPLYSFGSETFNGAGSVGYNWQPKGIFKSILLQTDYKQFSFNSAINDPNLGIIHNQYRKIAPGISFTLRETDPLSTVTRRILLKGYFVSEDSTKFMANSPNPKEIYSVQTSDNIFGMLQYQHRNDRTFNPFSYQLEAQTGRDFLKMNIEGQIRIDYHLKKKGLHIRAFAGKYVNLNSANMSDRYWLNTSFTGINDYLYDDTYLARSETRGLGARQFSRREGGFKIPTNLGNPPVGRSDDWLAAVNLETDIPWVPFRIFLDIGSFGGAAQSNPAGNSMLYNGGVSLHLFSDMLAIYVPLVMSKDYRNYQKSTYGNEHFINSIAFSIQLNKINWINAASSLMRTVGN